MANTVSNRVTIERDVPFAYGLVDSSCRPLLMDIYRPVVQNSAQLPAVILAFGGAFHRGSRQDDKVTENGKSNTAIAEYCRRLAEHGYVAFAVDYRLAHEKPEPGQTPVLANLEVPLERIQIVRDILGLPPISSDEMRGVQEAAIDDMASAFRFVAGAARRLGVDPQRIVIGGFSAGGRNAISAAFGEDIDPAGVICMSSYVPEFVIERYVEKQTTRFPVLAISAENDLGYITEIMPKQYALLCKNQFDIRWCVVPEYGHFYPAEAVTMSAPTNTGALSVFDEILNFLTAVGRGAATQASSTQSRHVDQTNSFRSHTKKVKDDTNA